MKEIVKNLQKSSESSSLIAAQKEMLAKLRSSMRKNTFIVQFMIALIAAQVALIIYLIWK